MKKRIALIALPLLLLGSWLFAGKRTNPPVAREVAWDSARTGTLFERACADCHSHATVWPWYAHLAPVSWTVIGHVNHGREHFNVSGPDLGDADEASEILLDGEMPLRSYLWMHPEARLTEEETEELALGLSRTFAHLEREGEEDGGNGH